MKKCSYFQSKNVILVTKRFGDKTFRWQNVLVTSLRCLWQVREIGDKFKMLVTLLCFWWQIWNVGAKLLLPSYRDPHRKKLADQFLIWYASTWAPFHNLQAWLEQDPQCILGKQLLARLIPLAFFWGWSSPYRPICHQADQIMNPKNTGHYDCYEIKL